MSDFKARMFNRKASDPVNMPDRILEALKISPGMVIADIGSGGGYFSIRFAGIVGEEGKVYSVDTNRRFLDFIQKSAAEKGLRNIETVPAGEDGMALPQNDLDLVFMRNITHHLSDRPGYFRKLAGCLKPEGRVAVIEYRPARSFSFRGLFGHHVAGEVIEEEMEEAGFSVLRTFDFLPEQHFTLYSPGR